MGLREQAESDFGRRVRDGRKDKGRNWSQAELAERMTAIGVPTLTSTVAKIEAQRSPRAVRLAEIIAIADLFDVSLDTLLGRQARPRRDQDFVLQALYEAATNAYYQINLLTGSLYDRATEAMAFDFDGRDATEELLEQAYAGLGAAAEALRQLWMSRPPEGPEQ